MKLWYGLFGAVVMMAFLASFVIKIKEPAMIVVVLIGVAMMVVDLWQSRNMKQPFAKGLIVGGAIVNAMTVTKGRFPGGHWPTHRDAEAGQRPRREHEVRPAGRPQGQPVDHLVGPHAGRVDDGPAADVEVLAGELVAQGDVQAAGVS